MGIFIDLLISKSVTKQEWEKVYEETLQLIQHLPLAEMRKIKIHGIDTICLVRTKEQEKNDRWDNGIGSGWYTVGDYDFLRTSEDFFLPRDLVGDNKVEPDAGDALWGVLPAYMDYSWQDERFQHVYRKWGDKTQGEPYHIYLLAVAALIEARLGTKAFTYGDITRGQFRNAVRIANQYLKEPIDLPDRCYMDRLLERITQLSLPASEQLTVFNRLFLGTKGAEFGDYMRQMFSGDVIADYWKQRFENYTIGTNGFNKVLGEYLLWGFGLKELCEYVNFKGEDRTSQYEDFIRCIMDTKLHLKDKNCKDILKINQEEERPYGVEILFAQFALAGAMNKKVNRYIPIEDIKSALNEALASKCNVEELIDTYLVEEAKEKDTLLSDIPSDEQEQYDIDYYGNLLLYEDGDTVSPKLKESLADLMKLLMSLLNKAVYHQLLGTTPEKCCEWLVNQNRYILIRDEDWEHIFTNIKNDINSFGRYYGLISIKMDRHGLLDMCKALMINDQLYEYCKGLVA